MSAGLDLIVHGGTVVLPDAVRRADLGIAGGRIAAIDGDLGRDAPELIDASGMHVLPGAVDAHVHLNAPGRSGWEGFASGTAALAAGGTTTFVDMPLNAIPPTTTAAAFDAKLAESKGSARIDFALWGGLVPGNVDEMDELVARGVVGFKAFMCDSGMDEFPACDEETLRAGMARAAKYGRLVAVHGEDDALVAEMAARAAREGAVGARAFLASRPPAAELAAIELGLALARDTGCSLHVVHVSTGRGVALVAEARAAGVDVTCETCPHYLVLTEEDLERLGAVAKCAPPLRPAAEREALWAAIVDGTLPMVASDHSPCPPEMKEGDLLSAWGGIAGAETMLTLLLDQGHHARGIALKRIVDLVAGFPARRFGLAAKGRIEVGADADLALVALEERHVLRREDLRTRHRLNPFVDRPLRGRVVGTVLRGAAVAANPGATDPPSGRFVRPNFVQPEPLEEPR
ncbi:MAG: allantoinase AllB [Solirubrobacterales bacterium]